MSRVLFTWELGTNLGHVSRLLPLATGLKMRGHTILAAVRDVTIATTVLGQAGIPLVQAPCYFETSVPQPASSYADLLSSNGWCDRASLWRSLQGWITLYRQFQPDVVVIDHSPTARLAARIMGIPCVLVGTGFALPPRVTPLPVFPGIPWATPERAAESERCVLENANSVLANLRVPCLHALHELVDGEARFLTTFSELDQYGNRAGECYVGPLGDAHRGSLIDWPATSDRRVFAYLRPKMTNFTVLLKGLAAVEASVVCYAPGINNDMRSAINSAKVIFASEPVQVGPLFAKADACLSYSPNGTVTAALLHGVPQLLAPSHVEAQLTANRVEGLGAGMVLRGTQTAYIVASMLDRIMRTDSFKTRARAFAQRYRDFNPTHAVDQVVSRIEEVARVPPLVH